MTTYAKSRFLRIAPGLITVMLILVFIVGPIVSANAATHYWEQFPFPSFVSDHLPGVFLANPYPGAVDGSLWTIKFEVLFYVLVALLGMLGLLSNRIAMLVLWVLSLTPIISSNTLGLLPFFATGMVFYAFRRKVRIRGSFAFASLILIVVSIWLNLAHWVLPLALGYLILWFSYTRTLRFERFSKYGDWSYGMYIYAFPIQQLAVQYLGIRQPIELFFLTLPITLILAGLSWHLVEKRALKLKKVSIKSLLSRENLSVS